MKSHAPLELRPASEADRTFIARLNFLTDTFGDETAQLTPEFDQDFRFYVENWDPVDGGFVAWAGNVPAGGVWLLWGSAELHGSGFIEEGTPELAIAIEPRFRGTGLASQLLEAAIDLAREIGAPGISLAVSSGNHQARGVYEHKGFGLADVESDSDNYTVMEIRF